MSAALEFNGVSILFTQSRASQRNLPKAEQALREGGTRSDIASQFGVIVGVFDASLRVETGQICVLVGLSGSGKSTLLRAANGLNRVSSGDVLLQDGAAQVNVASCDNRTLRGLRRRRIAMVFQQFGLLPWRSVRANVGLGLELRGEKREHQRQLVDEKLELVGLSQWADRPVGELSGGMQQRVGLARAFATDADILLMDEPFSALDPLIRSRLQDELLSLQARVQKTILFVTHDMNEALRLGNQVSILDGGRIVQTGTVSDIVTRPCNDYVAAFVRHMNPLTVLTAEMVMQPMAELHGEQSWVWLDAEHHLKLQTDPQGRVLAAWRDGAMVAIAPLEASEVANGAARLMRVPGSCSLQTVVALHRSSNLPVLVEGAGGLVGVCGAAQIVAALDQHRQSAPPGNPS
ncbi:MAG TPA: ATP-binding cassette domain-containing protein [Steroidobacteraceae bacterium]|nr:ATP-binding cassette domain-containing protein [Steroidobacteraceae bacterium]